MTVLKSTKEVGDRRCIPSSTDASLNQIIRVVQQPRVPANIIRLRDGQLTCSLVGEDLPVEGGSHENREVTGIMPAIYPEWLGDRSFAETHTVRFPYVVGEMAQGIATSQMVIEAARNGCVGFFGSAGLHPIHIDGAIVEIQKALGPALTCWGANLIHSPGDAESENKVVDVMLARKVRRLSASAFMEMAPSIVRYAAHGLFRDKTGSVQRSNYIFAKVSRPEVARHFMSPPPEAILRDLVSSKKLTIKEADLASTIPVAEDITCEADSGGHTDNRPLGVLMPILLALRDELSARYNYQRTIRIGAAGGLGTPNAVASAFQLGAAYVLTGSINQSAIESGLSVQGRGLLCHAEMADMAMAPAADMFELGVKVQVLKRGTIFALRGQRLYDLYRQFDGLDALPSDERKLLEEKIFRMPLEDVWINTKAYFNKNDPSQVERAMHDPKHKMALVFRWYLFMGSKWARDGDVERIGDYQIWCGPAMGAFNDWCKGSFMELPENRTVMTIARNLLEGAAVISRAQQMRSMGIPLPSSAFYFKPRPLD